MSSVCPFFHFYFLCFILNLLPPPIYTLFPYTTLFRSKGTEFAGAFKNIVAIASGLVNGQKLGKNLERSEEHTSELQSRGHLVCRLLLEKKKTINVMKRAMTLHFVIRSL